jgi:hypothetical protein
MTRLETLRAHKQLLVQRIKQSKHYASPHQLRAWRKRVARYNAVIKLFTQSTPSNVQRAGVRAHQLAAF